MFYFIRYVRVMHLISNEYFYIAIVDIEKCDSQLSTLILLKVTSTLDKCFSTKPLKSLHPKKRTRKKNQKLIDINEAHGSIMVFVITYN